jgi:iron complex outermembrane receptor protein
MFRMIFMACAMPFFLVAQQTQLEEVVVSSPRIELPFKENSRTITVITSQDIVESSATTLIDILRFQAGIDLRSRGMQDTQTDVYIRGGGFDQVLLLIDGIKVDDPQTGHHTLNSIIPLAMIERIEIVKGAAARIFGQNAFTGAINIITKKKATKSLQTTLSRGAFDYRKAAAQWSTDGEKSHHAFYAESIESDGYRYNTDFYNQNYVWHATWNKSYQPINMIATFANRHFGANGFYASPENRDQYEATQSSLLGFSTHLIFENWVFKPKLYWKRGQDEYVFIRNNPSIYRNLHITDKLGSEFNVTNTNKWGTTGFGLELASVAIQSNNLGQRDRTILHGYFEHRFVSGSLDITPGFALSHYSDQDTFFYPGIDLGWQLSSGVRIYANSGYTYRIPTYTDLFYSDRSTQGNPDLDPEKALTTEVGIRVPGKKFQLQAALFHRDNQDYIDYVKFAEDGLWQATNIDRIESVGGELDLQFVYGQDHKIQLSYAYLEDDVDGVSASISRYAINSLQHHLNLGLTHRWSKELRSSIAYRYAERETGSHYTLVNASLSYDTEDYSFRLIGNNIFNEVYSEQNLVPMPKGHAMLEFTYRFH